MSDHYEVVFSCFLRDDTPRSVLAELRWHLGVDDEPPETVDLDRCPAPLLDPDPDSPLPGGDVGHLRRQSRTDSHGPDADPGLRERLLDGGERHAWGLYSRSHWLDDDLGRVCDVLELVAPHLDHSGYGGHYRDVYGSEVTVFVFDGDGGYEVRKPGGGA
ncbi:hypothetical protein [Streptomonospora nanhaiensis]|uniref:Uncharacterized protein n=1 Tax=Streptomonospora nanhaiensis TaxID=1323731 RepID=A0A853BL15_9ACTN|nr:hypothetical protein [Streptomonospora nanhaiensis]MBV2365874.1 hypothetical protein [Streptomonospora nanhaiensis]NYI95251.1 hypothetical protein [Streptomonospora nanhaiensis]